jgi:lipopolysaccharide export LptBFGC system permease protein LptF
MMPGMPATQVWEETVGEEKETGGRTAVFGKADQEIRFDSPLRGYRRLQELVKDYLEKTGDPKRWREPQPTFIRVGRYRIFLWLFILLAMANLLAALLTLVFALIQPLARFGPPTFTGAAVLVGLMALMIGVMRLSESRYMHPSRKGLAPVDELTKL